MRNPYESLAVPRTATADDIKKSFRQLAKKLHPDANKNDPDAAALFAGLNAAHEILSDKAKRRAFDRGEIDAEGKPARQLAAMRSRRYSMDQFATRLIIVVLMLAATSTLIIRRLTPLSDASDGERAALSQVATKEEQTVTAQPQQPERGAQQGDSGTSTSKATATLRPADQNAIYRAPELKLDPEQIGFLIARSRKLMSEGDFGAARTLLVRAAESRDPRAALALGSTYDPIMLTILQARGVAADVLLARIWYSRASEFGSDEARERLELLTSAHIGDEEPIAVARAEISRSVEPRTAAKDAATAAASAKSKSHTVRPPIDIQATPDDPSGVYVAGARIGADPDPNIRAQLMRDDAGRQLRIDGAGRQIFTNPVGPTLGAYRAN
jgi:curved DNA-binding protein CbpA